MEPHNNQEETETMSGQTADTTETAPAITAANTADTTIDNTTIMGILCYLGPLVLVPYFAAKDDPFVKFHIKQGFILFGLEIAVYILSNMLMYSLNFIFGPVFMILNIGLLILIIVGIVNVVKKREAPLPLVGVYASRINI